MFTTVDIVAVVGDSRGERGSCLRVMGDELEEVGDGNEHIWGVKEMYCDKGRDRGGGGAKNGGYWESFF